MNADDRYTAAGDRACYFFHFGLIVTGVGERDHLPKLFRSLMTSGVCTFQVIGRIGQRGPITSSKRKLELVGSGKTIPDKDATEIGLSARRYLSGEPCRLVVLIDDLEHDRRGIAQQVFNRYRLAMDTMLPLAQRQRAAVHFLVNMLEAYYFADAAAINAVLELQPPLEDYAGDVETITHPKGELKRRYPGFDEVRHGGEILGCLDVERVLARPDTCSWLRTLFAWCVKALERSPVYEAVSVSGKYRLQDGMMSTVTQGQ